MTSLADLTYDELYELAQSLDIEGRSTMTKDALREAVEAAQSPPEPEPEPEPESTTSTPDLAAAKHEWAELKARLLRAQNQLRAARSISTIAHRIPKVTEKMAEVESLREETQAARERLEALRVAHAGTAHRTSALGRRPGRPDRGRSDRG